MYFDKTTEQLCDRIEPFSLAAFAISKGKTACESDVTPQLFTAGQEVKLKEFYPELFKRLPWKSKYKRYFSAFTVIGASWSIDDKCWYYLITQRRRVFFWVDDNQITPFQTVQAQLSKGPRVERLHRRSVRKTRLDWWPLQQQYIEKFLTK